jgi:O-antigen/teichoic acid export membrane protein
MTANAASASELSHDRLIPVPYLLLRGSTAAGAVLMGFVQTFVFARILTPERFSVFIIVGAIGFTIWLAELGLPGILFVNLRGHHLAGRRDEKTAREATAVVLLFAGLAIAASLICFAIASAQNGATIRSAFELAAFLLYVTLNLPWSALRSVSIAVDQYIFYERLELARRVINITAMIALLTGLPITAFLAGTDVLWALAFAAASTRLVRAGALTRSPHRLLPDLLSFVRSNRTSVAHSSAGALSAMFITTFPYYVVPIWFGLGAAPIILEVTFKIYRGSCVLYAAICDLALPGQTRAFAAHEAGRLVRTTLLAAGLCCIPAAIACCVLIFAGAPFYALLLKSAATVPSAVTPILVVLLIAAVIHTVAEILLQHTGFFRSVAIYGACIVAAMVAGTVVSFVAGRGLTDFLAVYAAVYAAGSACLAIAALLGPIRTAALQTDKNPAPGSDVREIRSALPVQPATPGRRSTDRRTLLPNQNP